MINLDGEYGGDTLVELQVCHHHLEFFVNRDGIGQEFISENKIEYSTKIIE